MKTRTIRCLPSDEDEIIDRMYLLGYNLKHRNEIDNVRKMYDGTVSVTRGNYTGSTVYTHEERNHYLSLLFEKDIIDPELDHNLEILEQSVDNTIAALDSACSEESHAKSILKSKTATIIGWCVIPLEIILTIVVLVIEREYWYYYLPFMLICLVVAVIAQVMNLKKRKKCQGVLEKVSPVIQEKNKELDDLLRQAKKYEPAVRDNYKK